MKASFLIEWLSNLYRTPHEPIVMSSLDHSKEETHTHQHHVSMEQASSRAFQWGIALNLIYVIVELVSGFYANSLALITDAGHNFSDVIGLALSLLAFRLAKAKPTETFTYGFKKSTILAALINATLLLMAVGILGYESILRLRHPQVVEGGIAALIAGGGILINSFSAFLFFKTGKEELNARGAYLHLLGDALLSIGVVLAGIVILYTHWFWLDSVVSLAVLVVILYSTWSLLSDSVRLSLDAVPKGVKLSEVATLIYKVKGVIDVHHIHVWAMSTTENALTAHVQLIHIENEEEKQKVIWQIKHELLHYNIHHATLEIETDNCNSTSCEVQSQLHS